MCTFLFLLGRLGDVCGPSSLLAAVRLLRPVERLTEDVIVTIV